MVGLSIAIADLGDDVALSIWEQIPSTQLKLEQILSLKMAQERPSLEPFAKEYANILQGINAGEIIISQLASEESDDISQILRHQEEMLSTEFTLCSENFTILLNDVVEMTSGQEMSDEIGTLPF
jgi:hypothetical protein